MAGRGKVRLVCVIFLILTLGQSIFLLSVGHEYSSTNQVVAGLALGISLCAALVSCHICNIHCSPFIPLRIILVKYGLYWFSWLMKRYHWGAFQKSSKQCTEAQTKFLLKIIRENQDTAYGRDFNFQNVASVEDFIKKHPLTRYEHYRSYIDRVAKGELGVMFHKKLSILGKTSGTTGMAKVFPISQEYMSGITGRGAAVTSVLRTRAGIPHPGPLQMTCSLLVAGPIGFTEGGTPVGSVTSFMMSDAVKEIVFCTPQPGPSIAHEPTSMYIHALFALRDENLGSVWAPFASSLFIFFRFLEISWNMLVQDIRCGTISENLESLSSRDREELITFLYPMPERANELERQFRMGFENIVSRIWPRMPLLYGVTSGSMQPFVRRLKKYCGDLRILSGFYISTEGLVGYACEFPDDGQTRYVCIANGIFCEFIHIDNCDADNPCTLLMEDVEVGECYELVITNKQGLYRYRMGDVVLITGFYNSTPVFQFQYRNGELLNLCSEKTTEVVLTKALEETAEKWDDVQIAYYVCAESPLYDEAIAAKEDLNTNVLYYAIFVELSTSKDTSLTSDIGEHKKFEAEFDANLRSSSEQYDEFRDIGKLGPPRVIFLDEHAFSHFRGYLLETSTASAGQLKIPKKLRKLEWIQLFMSHAIKSTIGADVSKATDDLV